MFPTNPFAELSAIISPAIMQACIVVMVLLVALGTIYDALHKQSEKFFRENLRKSQASGKAIGGEKVSMMVWRRRRSTTSSTEVRSCSSRR